MLSVSHLFIYPVKSLGGISVSSALITDTGLKYDRRWMLVDENMRAITQREVPQMALLQVELISGGLKIFHKQKPGNSIIIPFETECNKRACVHIFDDTCEAVFVNREVDEWFSQMLLNSCRLVYMPFNVKRSVDKNYAHNGEVTSFADAFPFLMINQASLDSLNERLEEALPINRFRPNIVFEGGMPFQEDSMSHFTINKINFFGVKPCARCTITTVNQQTATKGKEPLQTLASYRQLNNKIFFGQNLLAGGKGIISVGDTIEVLRNDESFRI